MLKHCVILNGPPGSGKDTLADLMTDLPYPVWHKHQFKERLYIDTALNFDMDVYVFMKLAQNRETKEIPHPLLMDGDTILSPREALIHTSETLIKPNHGSDYFGKAAAEACLKANSKYAVFADGGFGEEVTPLLDIYERVDVIHLYREGFSFEGDSRNYIDQFPDLVSRVTVIEGNEQHTLGKILEVIREPQSHQSTQAEVLAPLLAYR